MRIHLAAGIGLLALTPAVTQAQPASGPRMTEDFELSLGLGASYQPTYLGSNERKASALPLLSARWRNGWFAGVGGIGFRFPTDSPLTYGLQLTLDRGRDEDDATTLRGLGDIKSRPELGAFASYMLRDGLGVSGSFRYGSGNQHNGLLADLGILTSVPLGGAHRLSVNASATFANKATMNDQYGVNETQSLRSGHTVYQLEAGMRDLGLRLGYAYALSPKTTVNVTVEARRLMGDAKSSPLARTSSGIGAGLLLSYRL